MSHLTNLSKPQLVLLHSLLWICFLFFPLLIYRIDFFNKQFFTRDLINNAFLISLFYLNFYFLIPRYFNGKQVSRYFVIILALIIVFVVQQMYVEYLFMHPENGRTSYIPGFEMHHNGSHNNNAQPPRDFFRDSLAHPGPRPEMFANQSFFEMPAFFWIGGIRRSLSSILTILLAGGFVRVATQWFTSEKQKEELEIQRLNDELGLLKAQINPHFLFNSLNTVYSLARRGSQNTEAFVLKLSEILRYVIYESPAHKVRLSSELTYIKNFIELQQYRIDKNMQITFDCTGNPDRLLIEPMLLITFVENAFKHGISYKEGSYIKIMVGIDENNICMEVTNTYNKKPVASEFSGIGLQNARKRLQLSYPNSHDLMITDENNVFSVHLKMKLNYA